MFQSSLADRCRLHPHSHTLLHSHIDIGGDSLAQNNLWDTLKKSTVRVTHAFYYTFIYRSKKKLHTLLTVAPGKTCVTEALPCHWVTVHWTACTVTHTEAVGSPESRLTHCDKILDTYFSSWQNLNSILLKMDVWCDFTLFTFSSSPAIVTHTEAWDRITAFAVLTRALNLAAKTIPAIWADFKE